MVRLSITKIIEKLKKYRIRKLLVNKSLLGSIDIYIIWIQLYYPKLIILNNKFYTYLEQRFKEDNLKKYHIHYDEYISNLTKNQLYYFHKDYKKWLKHQL